MSIMNPSAIRSHYEMVAALEAAISDFWEPDRAGFRLPRSRLTIRRIVQTYFDAEPESRQISWGELHHFFTRTTVLSLESSRRAVWSYRGIRIDAYSLPSGDRIYVASRSLVHAADYLLASVYGLPITEADFLFLHGLSETNGSYFGLELLDGLAVPTRFKSLYTFRPEDLACFFRPAFDELGDYAWANLFQSYNGLWDEGTELGTHSVQDSRLLDRLRCMFMMGYEGSFGPMQMIIRAKFRRWVSRYAHWVGEDYLLGNVDLVLRDGPFCEPFKERIVSKYVDRIEQPWADVC